MSVSPVTNDLWKGNFHQGDTATWTSELPVTTRTYSLLGDLLTETSATGTDDEGTRTFVHNTRGQIIEERDALYDANFPELHNTRYCYDTDGFLVKKIEAAANTSDPSTETCTYLTGTRLKETCTIDGSKTEYLFDHRNRIVGSTVHADDDTQLTRTTEHDELARTRSTTDAYGRKTYVSGVNSTSCPPVQATRFLRLRAAAIRAGVRVAITASSVRPGSVWSNCLR